MQQGKQTFCGITTKTLYNDAIEKLGVDESFESIAVYCELAG